METITKIQPYTDKTVEATRFNVWSWRDGGKWFAACPEMPNTLIQTSGGKADAVNICMKCVLVTVNEVKHAGIPVPWKRWKPKTQGMYSVSKFSVA
jgi:hypothetical protein